MTEMLTKRTGMRTALISLASFGCLAALGACGELSGPESPSTPTNVVATLASATSVTVTWTPSPLNDGVISYTIYRNGTAVGESTTNTYTDTGLAQQTTYVYSVAANCLSGIVSDRSVETAASTVTTVDVTPPRVLSTIPVNGATGVSRAGTSIVTFSEPMDPLTINTTTFNMRVSATGQILPGTVTYNQATRVAEFIPTTPLPNSANITVTVSTGAKDLAGNALAAPFTVNWTTRDEEGPIVIATSPLNGATGVPTNTVVTVTFNDAMDANTVNATNFTLRVTSSGAAVAGVVTYNASTRVATFQPNAPLSQATNYTATVAAAVRDAAGNEAPAPFQFTFTTTETTPPTVVSVVPANNATGVAVNSAVQVTFSEPMDQTTISGTTISLRNTGTSAVVPATVTYNTTTNVATLTPTGPLSNATNYTFTVTTGVRDVSGNALATQFTSTFTTAVLADATPPTVVSRSPAAGATGVPMTLDSITVTFSEPMDLTTITLTTIRLTQPGAPATSICTSVSYLAASNTAVCRFTPPLLSNTTYTITATTGARDVAGNALTANATSTFTTVTDTAAPTVLSRTPTAATGVPRNTTVTITFSEAMDLTTINGTTFTVVQTVGGVAAPGTVSYNTSTHIATFTPTGQLLPSTQYTVTATTGARDLAGNGLTGNFTFNFTTGL